jgi:hypothetical protein
VGTDPLGVERGSVNRSNVRIPKGPMRQRSLFALPIARHCQLWGLTPWEGFEPFGGTGIPLYVKADCG